MRPAIDAVTDWPGYFDGVYVLDAPPASLAYVPNSTTLDGNPIPDSAGGTPFPLDNAGYSIPPFCAMEGAHSHFALRFRPPVPLATMSTLSGTD